MPHLVKDGFETRFQVPGIVEVADDVIRQELLHRLEGQQTELLLQGFVQRRIRGMGRYPVDPVGKCGGRRRRAGAPAHPVFIE